MRLQISDCKFPQWNVEIEIERLLATGLMIELTMHRCLLRKKLYVYFSLELSSLPI